MDRFSSSFRVESEASYGKPEWKIGEEKAVWYDPKNPSNAILNLSTGHLVFGRMFLLMGIQLILIGLFFISATFLGPHNSFVIFMSQFFSDGD